MALLSLEDYPVLAARNRAFQKLYRAELGNAPGIRFPNKVEASSSNEQYVVLEIAADQFGVSRDQLVQILRAENVISRSYFTPVIIFQELENINYQHLIQNLIKMIFMLIQNPLRI